MYAAGKRSGFASALENFSRRTSFGYVLAQKKKEDMNSDELDSFESVAHIRTPVAHDRSSIVFQQKAGIAILQQENSPSIIRPRQRWPAPA
jgi:hypothetical protein